MSGDTRCLELLDSHVVNSFDLRPRCFRVGVLCEMRGEIENVHVHVREDEGSEHLPIRVEGARPDMVWF